MTPTPYSILAGLLPAGGEWILILLVVVLLFGATKLPQLAKGIGQSIKEFKKASKDGGDAEPAEADLKAELAAAKAELAATKAAKRDDAAKTHGSN